MTFFSTRFSVMVLVATTCPACGIDGTTPPTRQDRLLGINLTASETGDDSSALNMGKSAGINATMIGYSWTEVEVEPRKFDYSEIDRANSVYASKGVKIVLMLNPVETDLPSVPSDLEDLPFDDPAVIERFKQFVQNVLNRLPDLDTDALVIGNEIDGYIGDTSQWEAYRTFYEAVGAYAKTIRPGIKIGVEGMFDGMIDDYPERMQELNLSSDIVALTYYPSREVPGHMPFPEVSAIRDDLTDLTAAYTGKPIYVIETGYPSSPLLESSEEEQQEFVRETFRVWDDHASQIGFLSFFLLHDLSPEYIDALFKATGLVEHPDYEDIREGILTLGLRTFSGKDKLAFSTLTQEAAERGWE